MNKFFAKIASLTAGLALVAGAGVALASHAEVKGVRADSATVSFSHTDISGMATAAAASTSGTYSGFTITVGGIASSGYNASESVRVYKGASITIASSIGNMTSVELTCTANGTTKYGPGCLTGDGYSAGTAKVGTWTGDASSFTLTASSNQTRISDFKITYTTGGGSTTEYTISYDANGGTGTMEDTVSVNPAVAACTFVAPEGKMFGSWNTEDDGTGDTYNVGDKPGADLSLYAIWVDQVPEILLDKIGTNAPSAYSANLATVDVADDNSSDTYTLNYVNGKKQNDAMILQKSSGAFISNHTEIPGEISSIEVFINNGASGNATYDVAFGTSEFTTATAGIGAVNITGGNSHVYENNVEGAKYFCVTLGANYNGQVLKLKISYTEESIDPSLKSMTIKNSSGDSENLSVTYGAASAFYAYENESEVSGVTWSTNDSTVLSVSTVSGHASVSALKEGSAKLFAEAEGYNKAEATITVNVGSVDEVVVSGAMSKTAYYVGDSWDNSGLVVTAVYTTGYEKVVTSSAEWTYSPASPAISVSSVVATATYGEQSGSSSAQAVTVEKTNQIQALYSKAKGATSGEFYGYYVGFATGSGPIVMDGAWGMMLYNQSQDVSGWTEGETIVHVTAGTIDIYNGLYEVKSYTCETVESADISTPITHTTTGNETAQEANRLTNASGKVAAAPTKGSFDQEPGASDVQFTYTVGSRTFTVYYKKAAQESTVLAALADSLANETEITIKGFTSWYNNFQVTMIGLVEVDENYTAAEFAQDLLDQTDAVCTGWQEGDNNYDELVAVWSNLQGVDKYPALPDDQKEILAETVANEEGSVIEQALARYEFLCIKYGLGQFINGHDNLPEGRVSPISSTTVDSNTAIAVVAIVAIASISAIAVILVIKRRRAFDR